MLSERRGVKPGEGAARFDGYGDKDFLCAVSNSFNAAANQ